VRIVSGRLRVTPGFFVLICICWYALPFQAAAYFLMASLIHELGHLAAARALGLRVASVRLELTGAAILLRGRTSYVQDLLLSVSGPAANLLCCALLGFFGERAFFASGLSFLLGFFNLLPMSRLDGGRALRAAVSLCAGVRAADIIARAADALVLAASLGLGIYGAAGGFAQALIPAAFLAFGFYAGLVKKDITV